MKAGNHSRRDMAPAWAVGVLFFLIVFGLGFAIWARFFA